MGRAGNHKRMPGHLGEAGVGTEQTAGLQMVAARHQVELFAQHRHEFECWRRNRVVDHHTVGTANGEPFERIGRKGPPRSAEGLQRDSFASIRTRAGAERTALPGVGPQPSEGQRSVRFRRQPRRGGPASACGSQPAVPNPDAAGSRYGQGGAQTDRGAQKSRLFRRSWISFRRRTSTPSCRSTLSVMWQKISPSPRWFNLDSQDHFGSLHLRSIRAAPFFDGSTSPSTRRTTPGIGSRPSEIWPS